MNELALEDTLVIGPQPETLRGKTVYVKRLNALESLQLEHEQQALREAIDIAQQAGGVATTQGVGLRFAALLIKHHICNSQGKLIYAGKSAEQLISLIDNDWMEDLYQLVIKHRNRLSLEDAEKNS